MSEKPLGLHDNVIIPEVFNRAKVSDFIMADPSWDIIKLQTFLPDNIVQQIRATPFISEGEGYDRLGWPGNMSGTFSVHSAYLVLTGEQDSTADHEWIWRMKCAEKIKVFVWLTIKEKLLTNAERQRRNMTADAACPVCEEDDETISHLFRECKQAREVWRRTLCPMNFDYRNWDRTGDWIRENCK